MNIPLLEQKVPIRFNHKMKYLKTVLSRVLEVCERQSSTSFHRNFDLQHCFWCEACVRWHCLRCSARQHDSKTDTAFRVTCVRLRRRRSKAARLWNGSPSRLPGGRVTGRKRAGRKGGSRSSSLRLQVVTLNLDLRPRPPSVWQHARTLTQRRCAHANNFHKHIHTHTGPQRFNSTSRCPSSEQMRTLKSEL